MAEIEKQNQGIKSWTGSTLQQIKNRYIGMVQSPNRSGDGLDSLKARTGKSFGEIDRVSFGFNRYLVFVHKGAGKGKGGAKGSSWLNAIGVRVKTNTKSLGKMNTGNRKQKEFLNPVLDSQVPKLADIVAGFKADLAVKSIQIK